MEGHNFNFEGMGKMRSASFNEDEIMDFIEVKEHMKVLDLGAGDGFFAQMFASRRAIVTAVDRDNRYFGDMNNIGISTIKKDICSFNDGTYDIVFMANVLHDLDCQERVANSISAMARNRLAIIEFKDDAPFGPPVNMRLSPDAVRSIFEAVWFRLSRKKELKYHYILLFEK